MTAIANSSVLVLNKSWLVVGVARLEKAISLLFKTFPSGAHKGQPKARIIDPSMDFQTFSWSDWSALTPQPGEQVIHGIGKAFRLPEVILLTDYDRLPSHTVQFSRRAIWRRDRFRCQFCGIKVSEMPGYEGTIDHVIPRSKGGLTNWENTVLACIQCNSQKADRLLGDAVRIKHDKNWRGPSPMKLLSIPVKPKFTLFKSDRKIPKSWQSFVSEVFWNTELENDN